MSLGVLNNLSAVYAENNLNNTNNSLNTVLQQLSSGSKINSGADDAAGLSLVDGLEANQTALTQSGTNATEGVGLLQVADGALSQVTSLLNRAVTLATEASNGTLNSSQDTAANQEYQSILSEISNIGSTTTYNAENVFGSNTNIYTGDSTVTGSSIDDLNIRTLSSANVGDSGGVMSYSNGQNNVFINLSSSTQNAQATDALNASGKTTIDVNYLVKGANGTETNASTSISVGTGTSYANTANGLMSAINSSGLGINATFTTESGAGVSGGGTQTGILITGGVVSVGVDPNTVSTSGTLNLTGTSASGLLAQGQTISIQSGSDTALSIAVGPSINTLSDLAAAINTASAANSGGTQVVASVATNSQGVQSLSIADQNSNAGALSVVTTSGSYTPAITTTAASGDPVALNFTAGTNGTATVPGTDATATLGVTGMTDAAAAAPLAGSLVLSNGASGNITVTMDSNTANDATHINLSSANSTLTGLASALNGSSAAATALGVSATVTSSGLSLTSNTTDTTIAGTSALTATPALGLSNNIAGAASTPATAGVTTLYEVNGAGSDTTSGYAGTDTLTGSIVVTNGSADSPGTPITFVMGAGSNTATTFYTGATTTVNQLLTTMGTGAGATAAGIASAALNGNGQIVLTSSTLGTTVAATSALVDTTPAVAAGSVNAATSASSGTTSSGATFNDGVVQDANLDPITGTGDALTGSLVLSNGGAGATFVIGAGTNTATTFFTGAGNNTLADLASTISGDAGLGLTATVDSANAGLSFATSTVGTSITVDSSALNDASTLAFTNPASGGVGEYASGTLALTDGGMIPGNGSTSASGTYTGSVVISNNGVSDTFVMGGGSEVLAADNGTITVDGNTLGSLITAINDETANGGSSLGINAVQDAASGGIFLQSNATGVTGLGADASGLSAAFAEASTNGTQGGAVHGATAANVTFGTGTDNSGADVLTGSIVIKNSGGTGVDTTFTMGGGSEAGLGTDAVTVNGSTMADLAQAINDDSTGAYAGALGIALDATVGSNGLTVTSTNNTSTISDVASALTENYGANVVATAGAAAGGPTNASAVLGADQSIGASDTLSGSIVLNNGGSDFTFTMAASSAGSTTNAINTNGTTLQDLATAISESTIGITANVVNGALQLQSNTSDTTISTVGTPTLKDTATETLVGGTGTAGTAGVASNATVDLASVGTAHGTDVLTGSIVLQGTGGPATFTMGATGNGGTTLSSLASAITGTVGLGINATVTSTGLSLTMQSDNATPITATSTLSDALGNSAASATLGSFRAETDTLSAGTISFTVGSNAETVNTTSGETVSQLLTQINGASNTDPYGVSASWDATHNDVVLTSDTYGSAGNFSATSSDVTDTTTGLGLSYSARSAYNIGISNSTGANSLYDSSTQSAPSGADAAYANFVADSAGSGGIATISYSDGAGVSLNATDLSNQADAQSALTSLNSAITAVAAQDGYIGAQINTLNAVSQVLSTQQENVQSAQNAVQATDYAAATSNMSKYEILSQTGIAALAQANSIQQEVTKLLQ